MRRRLVVGIGVVVGIALTTVLTRPGAPAASATTGDASVALDESVFGIRSSISRTVSTPAEDRTSPSAAPRTRVTIITLCDGSPTAGVAVKMFKADDERSALTDDTGRAEFEVAPGEWNALATLDGYSREHSPSMQIVEKGEPVEVTLELRAIRWIEGVVVDEQGNPLGDVDVNGEDETDDGGRFRISVEADDDAPHGYASLLGFEHWYGDFIADAGDSFRITLRHKEVFDAGPGTVSGTVVEPDGQPAPSILVGSETEDAREMYFASVPQGHHFNAITKDDGSFTIRCPLGKHCGIRAWGGGQSDTVEAIAGQVITLRLRAERSVSLRAIDEHGIVLTQVRLLRGFGGETSVSSDGRFTFHGFDTQDTEVEFTAPRFSKLVKRRVDLRQHDVDLGDVIFTRGQALRGAVVDRDGAPISGANVACMESSMSTNAQGQFELWLDPSERSQLEVSKPGFLRREISLTPARTELRVVLSRAMTNATREFGGIGLVYATQHRDGWVIEEVMPNSPALEAGLRAGDVVVAVDGVPYTDFDDTSFVLAIRGEEGTVVQLSIRREGRSFDVRITRRRIVY